MKHIYVLCFLLLLTTAYSCRNEEDNDVSLRPIRISSEVLSRSAMESGFMPYDEIGIFMLERPDANTPAILDKVSGNWLDNGYFSLEKDQNTWSPLAPVYWKDATTRMDIIAYYPYIDMASGDYKVTSLPLQVQTDQRDRESLRQSDFLYASQRNLNPQNHAEGITLGFRHKLCKLTVQFRFNAEELENAQQLRTVAYQVKSAGFINLNTGSVTTNPQVTGNIMLCSNPEESQAEGIFFPQTIPAGTFLRVVIGEGPSAVTYEYTLTSPLTLEEGKEYLIPFDCTTAGDTSKKQTAS